MITQDTNLPHISIRGKTKWNQYQLKIRFPNPFDLAIIDRQNPCLFKENLALKGIKNLLEGTK